MSTTGPQDSPTWPPAAPQQPADTWSQGPQDRIQSVDEGPTPSGPLSPVRRAALRRLTRHPGRFAAAAAGAIVLAGAGTAFALGSGHWIEDRHTLTHEVTALTIDGRGADVTVRSGAGPGTVELTRRIRSASGSPPTARETWQGSTLALEDDCAGICDISYEIHVPNGVAVTAQTGSGDITLRGRLGVVSLETGSGDVEASLLTSSLTARTSSGDIDLRLRSPATQISANSGSGDVDIRLPSYSTYAVDSRSGSGDVEVNVPQLATSDNHVQVRTETGDITLQAG